MAEANNPSSGVPHISNLCTRSMYESQSQEGARWREKSGQWNDFSSHPSASHILFLHQSRWGSNQLVNITSVRA